MTPDQLTGETTKVLYWLECLAVNQRDHAKGSEYDILLHDLARDPKRVMRRKLGTLIFTLPK